MSPASRASMKFLSFLIAFLALGPPLWADAAVNIDTRLMEATFKLRGPDNRVLGTCFVLTERGEDDSLHRILVTAAHVLNEIPDEKVIVVFRTKEKKGNAFERMPREVRIRRDGIPIWTEHPKEDIAALRLRKQGGIHIGPISPKLLATDEILKRYEIHPGDELSSLGFPLGSEANEDGFPILRNGTLASYPIVPTAETRTMLFDSPIFDGNSGGPVFFVDRNRNYAGHAHPQETIQFISGMIVGQRYVEEATESRTEKVKRYHYLSLGIVVHASLIKETLELLPEPEARPIKKESPKQRGGT